MACYCSTLCVAFKIGPRRGLAQVSRLRNSYKLGYTETQWFKTVRYDWWKLPVCVKPQWRQRAATENCKWYCDMFNKLNLRCYWVFLQYPTICTRPVECVILNVLTIYDCLYSICSPRAYMSLEKIEVFSITLNPGSTWFRSKIWLRVKDQLVTGLCASVES